MPSITFDMDDFLGLAGSPNASTDDVSRALLRLGAELKDVGDGNDATIEVLANRMDMFSAEGIARAVRPFLNESDGAARGLVGYSAPVSGTALIIDKSVLEVRPYAIGAVVKDVRMSDYLIRSLMDIQEKLHLTLGRKRAKVSIGVHDSAGIVPPYTYKAVEPSGLRFVPLGMDVELDMNEILQRHEKGKEYGSILQDKARYPVIVDSGGQVLSFPPIINGTVTTVRPETEQLFIDITGTDRHAVGTALTVLATSLADRGAAIEAIRVKLPDGNEIVTPDLRHTSRTLNTGYANGVLGTSLSPAEMAEGLKMLRYGAAVKGSDIEVTVPCYRSDVLHPVDMVEDIAMGFGYERLALALPKSHTFGSFRRVERLSRKLENLMTGHGFTGTFTSVLSNDYVQFTMMGIDAADMSEILNPISGEQTCVRVSLLPSLLAVLSENKHRELPQKLFEVSDVVVGHRNAARLAFVIMHSKAGFTECKSVVESILSQAGGEYNILPWNHKSFIDGRCASVEHRGKDAGFFGEIHPDVLVRFGLGYPATAAELDVGVLFGAGSGK